MGHRPPKNINKHPSAGCKQHLSTAQLVERTQEDRVRRKLKKDEVTGRQEMTGKLRCELTYQEALDLVKTVIGLNHSSLQQANMDNFLKARDEIAKIIVDNLSNEGVRLVLDEQRKS